MWHGKHVIEVEKIFYWAGIKWQIYPLNLEPWPLNLSNHFQPWRCCLPSSFFQVVQHFKYSMCCVLFLHDPLDYMSKVCEFKYHTCEHCVVISKTYLWSIWNKLKRIANTEKREESFNEMAVAGKQDETVKVGKIVAGLDSFLWRYFRREKVPPKYRRKGMNRRWQKRSYFLCWQGKGI